MVRLDRITLNGFKSFAGKITIPFPVGFNCICGPNGSGKSNIVDALMFILGTSSARSIRAQKLQNLLFNGGKDRKPADYCEVSLYLDNSDSKVPGYEKEIKVTRRITRSGISVYKLDGKTVTKNKILDLLINASLSTECYNIIMQGDVTKVIEMNPMERRGVIDEISGIAEFDEKRAKAISELEKVETRVRENMIVVAEKQRLVARLKEEKENAEKYEILNNKLRKSKASLLRKRIVEIDSRLDEFENNIIGDSKKFEEVDKNLASAEKELESKEKIILQKSDEIVRRSRDYEIMRKIDNIQTEILRKKDKIDVNENTLRRIEYRGAMKAVMDLKLEGIYGTVSSLITIPKKYSTALEVAIGGHSHDIVVSTDDVAEKCIKFLKEKKIGRARFLPLNKISAKSEKKKGGIYAIDTVEFDKKFYPALEYVLGNTTIADDIEKARKMVGRTVTLDGDLIESSGAMIGGYYEKRSGTSELREENEKLGKEITTLEKELEKMKGEEKIGQEAIKKLDEEKSMLEKSIEGLRIKRRELYEEKIILQNNISKYKIDKAKLEANAENMKLEFEEYKDIKDFLDLSTEELQENVRSCVAEINKLGPINMKAIEEYKTISFEFEELRKKLDKLLAEKASIINVVQEVEKKRYEKFMETFNEISKNFMRIYKDLVNGFGQLRLEIENNIDSGLIIEASPAGKKVLNLDSMSGGEKTVTSLAFLFSIMEYYSAPFYVLDEVDAALDKANTRKIVDLLKKYSKERQFVVITHNDFTIQEADKVFGVSMEDGVSKVFGIELPK